MNCYESAVNRAESEGFTVIEKHFKSSAKGLCKGNKIGISKEIESAVEKRCILAEEIAHSYYTVGNILDQRNFNNLKQERYARKVAYENLVTLPQLIKAYKLGLKYPFEIAEHLEVTEEFLKSSLYHYQSKYGIYARHGNYIIYFSPLIVTNYGDINAAI